MKWRATGASTEATNNNSFEFRPFVLSSSKLVVFSIGFSWLPVRLPAMLATCSAVYNFQVISPVTVQQKRWDKIDCAVTGGNCIQIVMLIEIACLPKKIIKPRLKSLSLMTVNWQLAIAAWNKNNNTATDISGSIKEAGNGL